jgi:hypothetical protein
MQLVPGKNPATLLQGDGGQNLSIDLNALRAIEEE